MPEDWRESAASRLPLLKTVPLSSIHAPPSPFPFFLGAADFPVLKNKTPMPLPESERERVGSSGMRTACLPAVALSSAPSLGPPPLSLECLWHLAYPFCNPQMIFLSPEGTIYSVSLLYPRAFLCLVNRRVKIILQKFAFTEQAQGFSCHYPEALQFNNS